MRLYVWTRRDFFIVFLLLLDTPHANISGWGGTLRASSRGASFLKMLLPVLTLIFQLGVIALARPTARPLRWIEHEHFLLVTEAITAAEPAPTLGEGQMEARMPDHVDE